MSEDEQLAGAQRMSEDVRRLLQKNADDAWLNANELSALAGRAHYNRDLGRRFVVLDAPDIRQGRNSLRCG